MKLGTVISYRSRFLLLTGILTGLVLGGSSVGLFLDHRFAERYLWLSFLTLGCWLLLAVQAFLAVVVMVRRLLGRRWVSALGWLLLVGLGAGVLGATLLPVVVLCGGGVSVGEPPPGSPEQIEADRLPELK